MDVQAFWIVIGTYNQHTIVAQAVLLVFLVCSVILSYQRKNPWMAKFALGIANLVIGIVFFAWYGTEPIQKYFALPLYLLCGGLHLFLVNIGKQFLQPFGVDLLCIQILQPLWDTNFYLMV